MLNVDMTLCDFKVDDQRNVTCAKIGTRFFQKHFSYLRLIINDINLSHSITDLEVSTSANLGANGQLLGCSPGVAQAQGSW